MTISAFVILICLSIAFGQVIDKDCGDVKAVKNLDTSKFLMGTWYEHARYINVYEGNGRCSSLTYSLNGDGKIKLVNKGLDSDTGGLHQIEGIVKPPKRTGGLLEVTFDETILGRVPANFSIIGTDYKNWAAVYTCQRFADNVYGRLAWILTRDRKASEKVVNEAKAAFTSQGISSHYLSEVDQTNCVDV